jgi:2-methylcitrate dehydratase PrpD
MGAGAVDVAGPAVPGGLAVKVWPCCYALQRPIAAVRALGEVEPAAVRRVHVRTPRAAVQPLHHSRPTTGLEGKFSLEYAIAAALLDGFPTSASFTDRAVRRPEARRLVEAVQVELDDGGSGLLDGSCELTLDLLDGSRLTSTLEVPPGAPGAPLPVDDLEAKVRACAPDRAGELLGVDWSTASALLTGVRTARTMAR